MDETRAVCAWPESDGSAAALRDSGDPAALDRLAPLVYAELRAIAHRQLCRERDGHTLTTTALVHEAYLRLVDQGRARLHDRAHVLALAAHVMRRVLVDYARRHRATKREGWRQRVSLDAVIQMMETGRGDHDALLVRDERAWLLTELDEALTRLAALDDRLSRIVECRFFGGLTEEEAGAALGVTARTVRRDWVKAKGWLHRALEARLR